MERVCKFLKDAGVYYLATVEGDQPRVRPFGTAHIFEGRLYIQTGKIKPCSQQILRNPKVEISAFHQLPGNADPGTIVEGADFSFWVGQKLTGSRLDLAGLDVELALKNMGGAEGPDPGLITLDSCQIVNTGLFQKITYAFHKHFLLADRLLRCQ